MQAFVVNLFRHLAKGGHDAAMAGRNNGEWRHQGQDDAGGHQHTDNLEDLRLCTDLRNVHCRFLC